jgi:hypothetical protein
MAAFSTGAEEDDSRKERQRRGWLKRGKAGDSIVDANSHLMSERQA